MFFKEFISSNQHSTMAFPNSCLPIKSEIKVTINQDKITIFITKILNFTYCLNTWDYVIFWHISFNQVKQYPY